LIEILKKEKIDIDVRTDKNGDVVLTKDCSIQSEKTNRTAK